MTASSRIEENGFKGVVILVLFIVLSIKSCEANAKAVFSVDIFKESAKILEFNPDALWADESPNILKN